MPILIEHQMRFPERIFVLCIRIAILKTLPHVFFLVMIPDLEKKKFCIEKHHDSGNFDVQK